VPYPFSLLTTFPLFAEVATRSNDQASNDACLDRVCVSLGQKRSRPGCCFRESTIVIRQRRISRYHLCPTQHIGVSFLIQFQKSDEQKSRDFAHTCHNSAMYLRTSVQHGKAMVSDVNLKQRPTNHGYRAFFAPDPEFSFSCPSR